MMLYVMGWVTGMVTGASFLFVWLHKHNRIQARPVFRWTCPIDGCHFEVSSSNYSEGVLQVADNHSNRHKREADYGG